MGTPIVQRNKSAPVAQDDIERALAVFSARKQFLVTSLNMGWQLALTVLVPVIIGSSLDDRNNSTPRYTLIALAIAAVCVSAVVVSTIRQVNKEQAAESAKKLKSKEKK